MSNALASSFHLPSSSKSQEQVHSVSPVFNISTPHTFAASVESPSAGPSTWRSAYPIAAVAPAIPPKRSQIVKNRTLEEKETTEKTHARLLSCIASDRASVLSPDVDTPFQDTVDVLHRLLPYHVFLQPREDLDLLTRDAKGKGKAIHTDIKDIKETKFALECHKRRNALALRLRDIQTRHGKRSSPDDQAILITSLVLDAERSETTLLGNELRTARAELERREKEKRIATQAARPTYYGPPPTATASAVPAQYYRGYPYAYTQMYGASVQPSSISTFSISPTPPTTSTPVQSAIPVQLPVASLPALHALGIVPVPAAALPMDGQLQPAAILRGSTSNGTMLSLEINVSSLQSAQMSGLAMVLNSLMSKSSASTNTPDTQSSIAGGNEGATDEIDK